MRSTSDSEQKVVPDGGRSRRHHDGDHRTDRGDFGGDFAGPGPRGGFGRGGQRWGGPGAGRGRSRGRFGPGGKGGPFGPGFGPGGPGGPWGPGFGPGGPGGFGGPRGRGGRGRARRGDVRNAVLLLLSEGQLNGYGLMRAIEERTEGVWRVSPGSMYPTLAQLVDEGLIAPAEGPTGGGTEYHLTESGGTFVTENREELERVWNPAQERWAEVGDLWVAVGKLMEAVKQVGVSGTPQQREQTAEKLNDMRRELYRMLGE